MQRKINLAQFEEIPPAANRRYSMYIRIHATGKVSLSESMGKALGKQGWTKIMFLTNPKGSMVLIRRVEGDENHYRIPQSNRINAAGFTQSLQKRHVRLPASYLMEWNEEMNLWVGNLDLSEPVSDSTVFPLPDLRQIV